MNKDYYQRHCEAELAKGYWNPAFSMWRAYEAQAISTVGLEEPILDLGCGDGTFGQLVSPHSPTLGIDLDFETLKQAVRLGNCHLAIQAGAAHLPFPSAWFGSILSNSAIEHMSELGDVLEELHRVLSPHGLLVFTVPSHLYSNYLLTCGILRRLGQHRAAATYARRKNQRASHINLYSPVQWSELLQSSGFRLLRVEYILSRRAMWLWEWPHSLFSVLQPIIHRVLSSLEGYHPLTELLSRASRATFGRAFRAWQDPDCGGNLFLVAEKER